jgi:S1-C subfamily serine protease
MGSPAEAAMAPPAMAAMASTTDRRLKLATLTDAARQKYSIPDAASGVLVESVANEFDLGEQQVRPGDVIVNVNGLAVASPDDVEELIRKAQAGQQAYLPLLLASKDGLRWVSFYTGVKQHG